MQDQAYETAATRATNTKWPQLSQIGLTQDERESRDLGIGGSDANVILSGNSERILDLWREKRKQRERPDLSNNLAVMLGNWTEDFNRQWYEQITGEQVSRVGTAERCHDRDWRRCTLDGFVECSGSVWEAKHTSAFTKSDEVIERYMPQLQHNMAVMKADRAILSVIFGNQKFEIFLIEADWFYQLELLEAEESFWNCVATGDLPVPAVVPSAPLPAGVRAVSFEGNNLWAAAANDWLQSRQSAKLHASACSLIKGLVETDVAQAFGHGIEAKRSKSGAVTIREKVA